MIEKNNKLCISTGKCDNQQQYKFILEAEMLFTLEVFTDNSSISHVPLVTVKNSIARKSLSQFTELFDVKNKTAVHRLGTARSKRKAI